MTVLSLASEEGVDVEQNLCVVAASLAPGLEQIAVTVFVFQQGLTSGAQLAVTGTAQPGNVQVLRAILRSFLV